MKKFVLGSVLALSGSLAMVGCTQASAVSESQANPATQMQHKQGGHGQYKGHKGGHEMGRMGKKGAGFEKLNLTEQQKAQMQALRKAQMEKRQGERAQRQAQMQQTRAQTEALINSPTINATALNTLADRQAAIAKQQFVERIQAQHAMAQILTPEQKATLKQMREERQAKFKNKAKGEQKGQTAQ